MTHYLLNVTSKQNTVQVFEYLKHRIYLTMFIFYIYIMFFKIILQNNTCKMLKFCLKIINITELI